MRSCDLVLWSDADALFSRFDVDIPDVIEPGKDLYLVQHDLLERNGPVPNTGVMPVRNSRWSRVLFHELWQKEEYIDHPWWETAAILDIMGYRGHLGGKYDFNQQMLQRVKFIGHEWNYVPQRNYLAEPIITHFAGFPAEERKELMLRATLKSLFNALASRIAPPNPERLDSGREVTGTSHAGRHLFHLRQASVTDAAPQHAAAGSEELRRPRLAYAGSSQYHAHRWL